MVELIDDHLPTLAECGGYMYLTESLIDLNGQQHSMVGVIPGICRMRPRPKVAYLTVKPFKDTLLLPKGEVLKVHEFHASELETLIAFAAAAFAIKEQHALAHAVEQRQLLRLLARPRLLVLLRQRGEFSLRLRALKIGRAHV